MTYTSSPFSADQYYLDELNIFTPVGEFSLKNLMLEVSYFEDIFRGTTSGHVLVNDAISFIENRSLTGNEFLKLSLKKAPKDSDNAYNKIEKTFRIYKIDSRKLTNQTTEAYTIHFCSEEFLLSEQIKISKAYNGKIISDIVTDILKNELMIPDNKIFVEKTLGLYDFVIPYKKPYEAINWLSSYARSKENETSCDFVFYEDKDGFNFRSIQSLIKQNKDFTVFEFYYSFRNTFTGILDPINFARKRVEAFEIMDSFDTLHGINSGIFANRVITVDPLLRNYYQTDFNLKKEFNKNKTTTLNEEFLTNKLKNRRGNYQYEEYDSKLKVLIANKDQKLAKYISDKPHAVANDIAAEAYIPNRTSQIPLSHYHRIKILISGLPEITLGHVVDFTLPSNDSTQRRDRYYSGKYLVSSIRHKFDSTLNYTTQLELIKESVEKPYPGWNETDAKLQKIVAGKL